jgi:hypothetical protein
MLGRQGRTVARETDREIRWPKLVINKTKNMPRAIHPANWGEATEQIRSYIMKVKSSKLNNHKA